MVPSYVCMSVPSLFLRKSTWPFNSLLQYPFLETLCRFIPVKVANRIICGFAMDLAAAYSRGLSPTSPDIDENEIPNSPVGNKGGKGKKSKMKGDKHSSPTVQPKMMSARNRQYSKLTEMRQNKVNLFQCFIVVTIFDVVEQF